MVASEEIQIIKELHLTCAEGLFEDGLINNPAQVSIIEYDKDQAINKYISVLTDILHPYSFYLFRTHGNTVREFDQYIQNLFSDSISPILYATEYKEYVRQIETTNSASKRLKLLFALLKDVRFYRPTSSKYFLNTLRSTRVDSFHSGDITVLQGDNDNFYRSGSGLQIEWELGNLLESKLLLRGNAPTYCNYFFSIGESEQILAISAFIINDNERKTKLRIHQLANSVFNAYSIRNEFSNRLKSLREKAKKIKKDEKKRLLDILSFLNDAKLQQAYKSEETEGFINNIEDDISNIINGVREQKKDLILSSFGENIAPKPDEIKEIHKKIYNKT